MPQLHLRIPVLIQQEGNTFSARPLFLPHPVVDHSRFGNVVNLFKSRIQQMFRGFRLNRENTEILFWYNFNPQYELKRFSFKFQIKKVPVNGSFSVVHFEMDDKTFLSFPAFDNYMVMLEDKQGGKVRIKAEAERIIEKMLLRAYQANPGDFNPAHFLALKREFVTDVTQEIHVSEDPFKFIRNAPSSHFRFFRDTPVFNGISELNKVGYALNDRYPGQLRRAWHREEIVEELYRILFRGMHTPVVLTGPEGAGRHSVLEETLGRHIRSARASKKEREQRIWYMDPTRVISGMSMVGMWEKRLEAMLDFIKASGGGRLNDKIFIDNPVALSRIGRSASNDLGMSQVLKPYLEKRQVQLVLIATPEEWKVIQEKDRAFSDLFQVIRIQAAPLALGFQMAMEQKRLLETAYDCHFTIQAMAYLFATYRNFFRSKALPGVVVKWMQQLAVKYRGVSIDYEEALAEFEGISGFKSFLLDTDATFAPGEVEQLISRSLVGQEKAVQALSDAIHLIKARLNTPGKPLASYLFIGPTGVGKTQAAKALAEFLTGSTSQLIRFDMNEYIDPYAPIRLVGDFANPEGQLISRIRHQPFGILLLDEIEKAHRNVHDLLLQVLDDGRLTDGRGRTADFSNTIIIMTSNLGAREVAARLSFRQDPADEAGIYEKEVRRFFRPEFINRIDRKVVFNRLRLEHILDISRLQIEELLQRDGFVRRTTMVHIDPKALDWVAQRGFDSRKGGRALKRQIEGDLTTLTAEQLISSRGDTPILFDIGLENQKLVPRITPLSFAEPLNNWIPELPDAEKARSFYEKLLLTVERHERYIQQAAQNTGDSEDLAIIVTESTQNNLNWALFQAKDQARELKERIRMILLNFQDYQLQQGPVLPFRLKLTPSTDGGGFYFRQRLDDLFYQKQVLNDIYIYYQYGTSRFDSASTELLQDYLDVAFLGLTRLTLKKRSPDKGCFRIEAYQTGKGGKQIEHLLKSYQKLLDSMQIQHKLDLNQRQIEVEGYGIGELFRAEEGIHLFFIAQEAPMPLMSYWIPEGQKKQASPGHQTILRLYDEHRIITDLRSGFTNTYHMTPGEMKVLLFAGLPEKLRKQLMQK